MRSTGDPYAIEAVSESTCVAVPQLRTSDELSAVIYPKLVYLESWSTANYGRQRIRACQQKNIPLVSRTDEGVYFAFTLEEERDMEYDTEKSCQLIDQLPSSGQQEWKQQFGSTAKEVEYADWLIYFSPMCGDTLMAALYPHWNRGGGSSFHYYFTFNKQDSLDFVGVSSIKYPLTPVPLKGWPK